MNPLFEIKGDGSPEAPHKLYFNDSFLVCSERIFGAYTIRWITKKNMEEAATALRLFYHSIQEDIVDRTDKKIFAPGVYVFEGALPTKVEVNMTIPLSSDSEEISEVIMGSNELPKPYASLDDFFANKPNIQRVLQREFKDNTGIIRVVTPYCDMFLERFATEHLYMTIMIEEALSIASQVASAIRLTKSLELTVQNSDFEYALHELTERVRTMPYNS